MGPCGSILQCRGDVRTWAVGAECKMTGAFLHVPYGICEQSMQGAPLPWKGYPVDARREQRVGEPDPIIIELDHVGFEGGDELLRGLLNTGTADQIDRRLRQSSGDEQCRTGRRREYRDPV